MSKAAELANLIGNINAGGGGVNRNLIINGAMNVAQRATSTSMAHDGTTSTHVCDRFLAIFVNMDELDGTLSQDSSAPDGFANSLKWATGTAESAIATTEYYTIMQKIEAQNLQTLKYGTSGAVPITLTFYVKSSITGTYGITLQQLDVSRNRGSTYTINSANTWEKKTITFSGDTSGVINDDNGEGLRVEWHLAAGSTYTASANSDWATATNGRYAGSGHTQNGVATTAGATWFLSGVQLEIGQNATEFEHEPFERALTKCQRYYEILSVTSSTSNLSGPVAVGQNTNERKTIGPYFYKTEKRAAPTVANVTIGIDAGDTAHAFVFSTDTRSTVGVSTTSTDIGEADGLEGSFNITVDGEM